MKTIPVLFLPALAILALAACSQAPASTPVTGGDRDAVLAYTESMADNLLAGYNAGDYSAFARDFDPKMKGAMTEAAMNQSRQMVIGKIGKYVSRAVASVERTGEFTRVVYTSKFEQEDGVTVQLVFNTAAPHAVSGLWFTSPKLRAK